jgi:hypothetical protein
MLSLFLLANISIESLFVSYSSDLHRFSSAQFCLLSLISNGELTRYALEADTESKYDLQISHQKSKACIIFNTRNVYTKYALEIIVISTHPQKKTGQTLTGQKYYHNR